ncbi:reverse transcriptase domain-containing protein [Tanacetum coccineum]|uniref:Reverse transcriptase domain-containing protein n=1 Tax=Tanacetum coccineum TaxID=301880 RepID=A0ABQ5HXD5_9ASTR
MSTLTFVDTHNMVAFLDKPAESDGFHDILDFLNANQIHYALTIQALIDKKKVIITKTSIRSDLHLEDAEGTDCLPTTTIFEELARMEYEKPSQKLTFYKAFFSPQWKFLIHTITQCLSAKSTAWNKFIFINQQLGDMSHHKKIYVNLLHTKKIFTNMRREGKNFSGRVTPLFETIMVQPNQDEGIDSGIPTDSLQIPMLVKTVEHIECLMLNASPLKNWHVKRGRDTKIPQSSGPLVKVGDKAVHKELGDRMERAATTASSLEAEQDSGSGPKCQDTILGDVDAQTRADGSSKRYSSMIRILQDIDREDLETLWKLVKTNHGDTRPENEHERVLLGDLKVMFEPDSRRIDQGLGSTDTIREREVAKDKAYAELERKCNEDLQDLDKIPLVLDMRSEIETLQGQVDGLHSEYRRLVLKEKKWVNYEQTLSILRTKFEGLESEKERLKASETQLLQEIVGLKHDRAAVVSKVVLGMATKLIRSDEMGLLISKLVKAAIFRGKCTTFKEVASLREPFILEKMPGYHSSSKEEFDRAGDGLANASYPFLAEVTADPYASVEQLLLKKPQSLRSKPALSHSKPSSLKLCNGLNKWDNTEDVVVRVDGFTFLADFVVVNIEPDPRVPIILGRPFLRTAKALIDLYEETLTLRVGKDELVYYADKSEKNKNKHCVHAIFVIDFSKDDPFSASTTTHSDDGLNDEKEMSAIKGVKRKKALPYTLGRNGLYIYSMQNITQMDCFDIEDDIWTSDACTTLPSHSACKKEFYGIILENLASTLSDTFKYSQWKMEILLEPRQTALGR